VILAPLRQEPKRIGSLVNLTRQLGLKDRRGGPRTSRAERFANRRMISCALNRHNTVQRTRAGHLSGMTKTGKISTLLCCRLICSAWRFTLKPHEPSAAPDGGTARIRLAANWSSAGLTRVSGRNEGQVHELALVGVAAGPFSARCVASKGIEDLREL
jgi:hypothetical protein